MNYLLIVLATFGMIFGAQAQKAPAPLNDSKIERDLLDGTKQKFDGNEYMIVKRGQHKVAPVVLSPVCPAPVVETEIVMAYSPAPKRLLNRVSLLGGQGPNPGLNANQSTATATVENKAGIVGGAALQHLFTERVSAGIQGQTNKTILIDLGLDF